MQWAVQIFAWSDSMLPRRDARAAAAHFSGTPLVTQRVPRLDYIWFRPTVQGIPQARWALQATTSISLPPGEYTLRAISDDGIRVWVDGQLVIDNWAAHGSAVDNARVNGGDHELRVQYYQVDGWTELRVEIERGRLRSVGSPGPH
jgi:hypothetical protein